MWPAAKYLPFLPVLATVLSFRLAGARRSNVGESAEHNLLARDGVRRASRRASDIAATFSVTDEQAKFICTPQLIFQTCEALGASPEGEKAFASLEELADTLAVTWEQAAALVKALGLASVGGEGKFSCRDFCFSAVRKIPTMLKSAVPLVPGVACVDAACATALVNVSEPALLAGHLSSPPPGEDKDTRVEHPFWDVSPTPVTTVDVFRLAVNVILGIFPSMSDLEDADVGQGGGAALVERRHTTGRRESGQEAHTNAAKEPVDTTISEELPSEQHEKLREYSIKGAAWVATALRKLRSGRAPLRKWFRLESAAESQVDEALKEARRHMSRILIGMNDIHITKGKAPTPCSRTTASGTLAYVTTYASCTVDSDRDCGEKKDGRHIINLCEFFWNVGESTRVGTMVHEMSHHFGTDDKAYGRSALSLPAQDARNNADTYNQFIEEVARAKLPDDGAAKPHPECNTPCDPVKYKDWDLEPRLPAGTCGKCDSKPRTDTFLVGKLFGDREHGEPCEKGEEEVAIGSFSHVCCRPLACELPSKNGWMWQPSA